ncbi:MAG: hypothetical protein RSA65_09750 [Clostridia bacterium]
MTDQTNEDLRDDGLEDAIQPQDDTELENASTAAHASTASTSAVEENVYD